MRTFPFFKTAFLIFALQTIGFAATSKIQTKSISTLQNSEAASLDAIIHTVLTKNPDIEAARANWQAMRERVPQARAWRDPQVGFDQRLERTPDVMPNSFMDEVALRQEVPVSGKNRSRSRLANGEAQQSYAAFQRAQWDAVTKAKIAWFHLVNLHTLIALNRQNKETFHLLEETTEAQYKSGKRPLTDILSAQTESAKNEEEAMNFRLAAVEQTSALNALMGRAPLTAIAAPERLSFHAISITPARAQRWALANRPELQSSAAAISAAKAQLQFAHREWIPDPSLEVKLTRYNGTADAVSEVSGGVTFSIPWANAGKYSAEIREAQARLESAQQKERAQQFMTNAAIQAQLEKIAVLAHHYALYQSKIIPLAQQSRQSLLSSYSSGKAALADVLSAQRDLDEAEATAQQHLLDHEIAISELESLIGADLSKTHFHEK